MRSASDICNPAWEIWKRLYGPEPANFAWLGETRMAFEIGDHRLRGRMIEHMGFAIPDPTTLDLIATLGPIVEIGAGTGYWAWCLRQMGVNIIAFDRYPPQTHPVNADRAKGRNAWFDTYWTEVHRGEAYFTRRYPDRSLLLVWPYMDSMALQALRNYAGQTVIYVGEERAACATEAFFDLLDREWTRVIERLIPQWSGINDEIWVLRRNRHG